MANGLFSNFDFQEIYSYNYQDDNKQPLHCTSEADVE